MADKEEAKLLEFKKRVGDLTKPESWDNDTDRYLERWLIARNWNLDKAEVMLRKSMEFRREHNCDSLLATYKAPEVLEKYYVGGICGFDKEGSPVWLDPFTLLDMRGLLHSATREQILLHKMRSCELILHLCKEQSQKLNKTVDQSLVIFDIAGLSWRHLWAPGVDCFKSIIAAFEDNYPEMLKRTYIVNAPRLFILAYNMIKSVISPRTRDKVRVLGGHWKEDLLKDIDATQLPVHYGGSQVDENSDPRCSSKVLYGGEIPKSYYLSNDEIFIDMHTIHIPRGSKKYIEQDISVDRCQLRYRLKSERHDVGYGFLYKPPHSKLTKYIDMEVIKKVERTNTHMAPQAGVLECAKPGTYILVLDNSFSWTKGKTVDYSVELVSLEGDSESDQVQLEVADDTPDFL